jgi:hemophore-related protein
MNPRTLSAKTVRRGLVGMFAGGLLSGIASATIVVPTANAAPDTCTASAMANTVSSVSQSTSSYLTAHPDINQQLTDISKQPATQAQQSYRVFFANNPQIATDLKNIQQPVVDLSNQCGLEVTPTPVVEALKAL